MYYYKGRSETYTYNIGDNDSHFDNRTPYQMFSTHGVKIWWHVNDTTGKIDMNINMADKELRKQALLNLA